MAATVCLPPVGWGANTPAAPGNLRTDTFSEAKRLLLRDVYFDAGHRRTLYCESAFDTGKNVVHDPGYVSAKAWDRANKLEWEHVVPAEAFGKSFREWREGDPGCVDGKGRSFKGRKCAEKVSDAFRHMEADLYNLYPECGEINGLRSNYSFALLSGPADFTFGACKTKISTKERKIEPRPEIRGDVARTYFYMQSAYPGRGVVSGKNEKLFSAWDRQDPVDGWECERARRIERVQGNEQPFVKEACRKAGLW